MMSFEQVFNVTQSGVDGFMRDKEVRSCKIFIKGFPIRCDGKFSMVELETQKLQESQYTRGTKGQQTRDTSLIVENFKDILKLCNTISL